MMERLRSRLQLWNSRIDRLWEEDGAAAKAPAEKEKRTKRQRAASFLGAHRWDLLFVLAMGCLLFFLSWILPFDEAPDEKMRYMIPTYIYRHGTLPVGWDPEIRSKIWGISYAFQPILPYIFSGCLMKLVSLFNSSEKALLMAARFINILIGMGFYWYVLQIAKKVFQRKLFRTYFLALLALLPQLLYLFVYVNTDGIAVFSGAMIIYYWLVGMERRWDRGSCTGLAFGVAVCALSYFNAYGYALCSIFLFIGSLIVFYRKRGARRCAAVILKRGIYIAVLVFLLAGWWFIRSAILYDGDILGMEASDKYGEMYAMEEYKPSVKKSLYEQGVPLEEMLRSDNGGMEWIRTTYRSTIGYFSYYRYALGIDIYEIHKRLFLIGLIGLMAKALLFGLYYAGAAAGCLIRRQKPQRKLPELIPKPSVSLPGGKIRGMNFWMLQFSLGCCIIIPVILSLYYSYMSDFQPQGRYIMPMIIPLMYFVAAGTERLTTLLFRRWFVYVMMVPLFYAVLHVFLAAYVSVYIPAFVESLASWSEVRFTWLSNVVWLMKLLHLAVPG